MTGKEFVVVLLLFIALAAFLWTIMPLEAALYWSAGFVAVVLVGIMLEKRKAKGGDDGTTR